MGYYGKIHLSRTGAGAPPQPEPEPAPEPVMEADAEADAEADGTRMERAERVLADELENKVFPVAEVRERMLGGTPGGLPMPGAAAIADGASPLQGLAAILQGGAGSDPGSRGEIHDVLDVVLNILSLGNVSAGSE